MSGHPEYFENTMARRYSSRFVHPVRYLNSSGVTSWSKMLSYFPKYRPFCFPTSDFRLFVYLTKIRKFSSHQHFFLASALFPQNIFHVVYDIFFRFFLHHIYIEVRKSVSKQLLHIFYERLILREKKSRIASNWQVRHSWPTGPPQDYHRKILVLLYF